MDKKMEAENILIDTSILIDYYRKKSIEKSIFYQLSSKYNFCISIITEFEFTIGFVDENLRFANEILKNIVVLNINQNVSTEARKIYFNLKKLNKLIPFEDLFIGATALYHNLPLATLNKKHFENIEGLVLI
jgi:tRNA(fMet)-specific endonuclease VapC